jgi:hypothetical protein
MGTQDRPIRLGMEPAIGSFLQLRTPAGGDGGRRLFPELDQLERICLSPFNLVSKCFAKIRKETADLILVAPVWQAQPC